MYLIFLHFQKTFKRQKAQPILLAEVLVDASLLNCEQSIVLLAYYIFLCRYSRWCNTLGSRAAFRVIEAFEAFESQFISLKVINTLIIVF